MPNVDGKVRFLDAKNVLFRSINHHIIQTEI